MCILGFIHINVYIGLYSYKCVGVVDVDLLEQIGTCYEDDVQHSVLNPATHFLLVI